MATGPPGPQQRIIHVVHLLPVVCEASSEGALDAKSPGYTRKINWHVSPREYSAAFAPYAGLEALSDCLFVGSLGPIVERGGVPRGYTIARLRTAAAIHASATSAQPSNDDTSSSRPDKATAVEDNDSVNSETDSLLQEEYAQFLELLAAHRCIPVLVDPSGANDPVTAAAEAETAAAATAHRDGYYQRTLIPVLHYMLGEIIADGRQDSDDWDAYLTLNKLYAYTAARCYKPGDIFWVHDYHLSLVPGMLRELIPDASIGFFGYSPFPSSEVFRCLARRKELLSGLLGASIVGFATYSYARHFVSSCSRIMGLPGHLPMGLFINGMYVRVVVFPVFIDAAKVAAIRDSAEVTSLVQRLRPFYGKKKVIVGLDDIENVRGIELKLNAYERLLTKYPHFRGHTVLIEISLPKHSLLASGPHRRGAGLFSLSQTLLADTDDNDSKSTASSPEDEPLSFLKPKKSERTMMQETPYMFRMETPLVPFARKVPGKKGSPELVPGGHRNLTLVAQNAAAKIAAEDRLEAEAAAAAAKAAAKIAERVSAINARFHNSLAPDDVPLLHVSRDLSVAEYFALLCIADAGLVIPIRDGLSTAAQEFAVCQQSRAAPLILSEFTATAGFFASATLVNPWDTECVVRALHAALSMPETERHARRSQMMRQFDALMCKHWAHDFVQLLMYDRADAEEIDEGTQALDYDSDFLFALSPQSATQTVTQSFPAMLTVTLDFGASTRGYDAAARRLILLDYDGTLAPICKFPEEAVPSPDLLRILESLCSNPSNLVVIVSGRDQDFLTQHLGRISNLGLCAEHGSFLRLPASYTLMDENLEHAAVDDLGWIDCFSYANQTTSQPQQSEWMDKVTKVFESMVQDAPGSHIETKRRSITWHYRNVTQPELVEKTISKGMEKLTALKIPGIEILTGKKNVEVRASKISKGVAASLIALSAAPVFTVSNAHLSSSFDKIDEANLSGNNSVQAPVEFGSQNHRFDYIFCAGDDTTDEDMFCALQEISGNSSIWTVCVAPAPRVSYARWLVPSTTAMHKLLQKFAASPSAV